MRSSEDIRREMHYLQVADARYNSAANEGGEGHERINERLPALEKEFVAALRAEFAAEWTAETFAARLAAWNAAVAPLVEAGKPVKHQAVRDIEQRLGFTNYDLARAKELLGIQ